MRNRVDAVEGSPQNVRVADVAAHELDVRGEVLGPPCLTVHLRDQRVEGAYAVPAPEQLVCQMRADEARAARDENGLRRGT